MVRIGAAAKIEKASRQQRMFLLPSHYAFEREGIRWADQGFLFRQATQEQIEGVAGYGEDEGCVLQGQEEMSKALCVVVQCAGGGG